MRKIICCFLGFGMLLSACGSSGYKSVSYAEEVAVDAIMVCDEEAEYDDYDNVQYAPPESPHSSRSEEGAIRSYESTLLEKKIIKDGDITIQTRDIVASKTDIDDLMKSLNAYYERENFKNTDYRTTYELVIRVPACNFEKLISSVEQGKDEVEGKNIRARDVTEEYVDITTRLATKREYLKQYTALLTKASTIKDILEIKENIRSLQEEIERAEGRLKYLNDQVTFSTLNVKLYKDKEFIYKPKPKNSFLERVKSGLNTGWKIIVEFVLFLVSIWSVLLFLILLLFFVMRRRKKRRMRKNIS